MIIHQLTQKERVASTEYPTELRNVQRQNDLLQKKFQPSGIPPCKVDICHGQVKFCSIQCFQTRRNKRPKVFTDIKVQRRFSRTIRGKLTKTVFIIRKFI